MRHVFLLVLMGAYASAFSQNEQTTVKFVNPASVAKPRGYSQAVEVDLGKATMLIMSGQVAFDKEGNLLGKDDFSKQVEQVFQNIKSILEAAGGSMNDLVKLNFFVKDMGQIQNLRTIRDRFINRQHPPASTLVGVSALFRDDVLIEVEAMAIVPKQ